MFDDRQSAGDDSKQQDGVITRSVEDDHQIR